jgi:nucleoside-diphosphate-sugar epimerase
MRVLVTGHEGYIGAVMVPVLRDAGHEVVGLDTGFFGGCTFGDEPGTVSAIRKDIRDVTSEDVRGFDAIVHLAALCNDPLGDLNPTWTYEINHEASVRLGVVARDAGVPRFLYSSSCSLYGAASQDDILSEDAPLAPLTAYAISKARTEEDLAKLADADFSPTFMRNATAYGVSPILRMDLVLNNLVGWAFTEGKVRILSDGTPWRPVVHVEDIARAFAAALAVPRALVHGQAFNVGAPDENYQVRDLAEIVRATVPGSEVEYANQGGPDQRTYRVDFGKLRRTLPNFEPRWNARSGAREIFEAFRRVAFTRDDFVGRRYVRLAHLRHLLETRRLDDTLRWTAGTR